jgi:hypothetical protein
MKKNILLVITLAFLSTFFACNNDDKAKGPRKERSVGGTSEILVVTQNNEQWNGIIGDSIRAFFQQDQFGLPQQEPIYKLTQMNVSNFSDMFRKHKSIIIVEIDPELPKAVIETGEDLWAAPQRVMKIIAPSREAWVKTFNNQKEAFKILFDRVERDRIMNILRSSADPKIMEAIDKKFDFKMTIPESFFIAKNEPDFMWIRKELDKSGVGFFIYAVPYTDTTQFDFSNLISTRDIFLQKYVPGPSEGSYMSTEKEFVIPDVKYISDYPTGFAASTRGMWNVVGDFMAGPFIAYTFVDRRTNMLVTVEGYVYAPNQEKRDQLLQMEAILYTLRFSKDK